jgi:parvulin-like peptidyl-prolyl isomerase
MHATTRAVFLAPLMLLAGLGAGCDMQPGKPVVIEANEAPPAPQRGGAVMATVNGTPLYMSDLHDVLVRDYGLALGQQFIADEAVRQELGRLSLPVEVTQTQQQKETLLALAQVTGLPKVESEEQLDDLLSQFLGKFNLTRRQWDATMTRNVRLARLAEQRVVINEETLRDEYFLCYGGKLKVRHIQAPSVAKAEEILRKLEGGEDFVKLAFQHSTNGDAKTGALLPDIHLNGPNPDVPPALVANAKALRVGEVSNPVQVGTNFHILRLENKIPPQDVAFADVKDQLRPLVRERQIRGLQQPILKELLDRADIVYVDPTLKSQHQQRRPRP